MGNCKFRISGLGRCCRLRPLAFRMVAYHCLFLGRVALIAQRLIVVKLSVDDLSVYTYVRIRAYVRPSVCLGHCGKTADRIRMPFGTVGRTGPGMRQVVGFVDLSTGRGIFGSEFGARHCNQWGLYDVRVRQRRDTALFPNYCGQTCLFSLSIITNLSVYDLPRSKLLAQTI